MPSRILFTDSQIDTIKNFASLGYTIVDIAKYFEVNRAVIYRLLKENSIELTPSNQNKKGKPVVWTKKKTERLKQMYLSDSYSLSDIVTELGISEKTISVKAAKMNLKKVPKKINLFSKEDDNFIRENISSFTLKELARKFGVCVETLSRHLKELGINERKGNSKCCPKTGFSNPRSIPFPENKEELYEDLKNPMYSHTYVAKRYGYSVNIISKWRKLFFKDFKTRVDTYLCKSGAEIDFENNILIPLGITYFYEYNVGKWKIDYYLGFNLLIEIQSDYYHKLPKVIEKDSRKKKELEEMGYKILYFWEHDLKNNVLVKNTIIHVLNEQFILWSRNLMNLVEVK